MDQEHPDVFVCFTFLKAKPRSHWDANANVFLKIIKTAEGERSQNFYLTIPTTVCLIFYWVLSPHNPLKINFQFSTADYVLCGHRNSKLQKALSLWPRAHQKPPLLTPQLFQNYRILAMTHTPTLFQSISLSLTGKLHRPSVEPEGQPIPGSYFSLPPDHVSSPLGERGAESQTWNAFQIEIVFITHTPTYSFL